MIVCSSFVALLANKPVAGSCPGTSCPYIKPLSIFAGKPLFQKGRYSNIPREHMDRFIEREREGGET